MANRVNTDDCSAYWSKSAINPKNWDLTAKKIATMSGIVALICAISLLVSGLMVQYPSASGAFFTAFGIVGAGALITLAIALVRHCQNKPEKPFMQVKFNK